MNPYTILALSPDGKKVCCQSVDQPNQRVWLDADANGQPVEQPVFKVLSAHENARWNGAILEKQRRWADRQRA